MTFDIVILQELSLNIAHSFPSMARLGSISSKSIESPQVGELSKPRVVDQPTSLPGQLLLNVWSIGKSSESRIVYRSNEWR